MEEHSRWPRARPGPWGELRLGSGSLQLGAHKPSRWSGGWGHSLLEGKPLSVSYIVPGLPETSPMGRCPCLLQRPYSTLYRQRLALCRLAKEKGFAESSSTILTEKGPFGDSKLVTNLFTLHAAPFPSPNSIAVPGLLTWLSNQTSHSQWG